MYQVSETYKRFDQKNNMVNRPSWDPSLSHLKNGRHAPQLRSIERNVTGFSLKDFAFACASSVSATSLGTNINRPDSGLTSWKPRPVYASFKFPEERPRVSDAAMATAQVKRVARYFGADLVGIAGLDRRWVYSHHYAPETGESRPVEIGENYKYVIAMGMEMDYRMLRTAPSPVHMAETLLTYSRMAFLVSAVAEFIRNLGYSAIPALNDTALNVPIAIDAGLGQLGRQGLLITPSFGPRQRICKVITDLPLEADHPIDFGVTRFCSACGKCARECPSQAVWPGELTAETTCISNNSGVLKWPLAAEKCYEYWCKVGTNCGICIRTCPFNKGAGKWHNLTRWLVKHAPAVDRLLVRLDDLAGYGKYHDPERFWEQKI
ncbi:MAG: reductive dehalogenase [Chloroflexota bacterium]